MTKARELEISYAARLGEFMRPNGRLRVCRPSCPWPDGEHEKACPEKAVRHEARKPVKRDNDAEAPL